LRSPNNRGIILLYIDLATAAGNKKALLGALFYFANTVDYFSDRIHFDSAFASASDTCGFAGIGI
jgi:hypothetical protein